MIQYHVSKGQKISSITVSGHAGFAKKGEDIVCAAVSTATIISANALLKMGFENDIKTDIRDGYFHLDVLKGHETIEKILENLIDSLKQLEIQYPKYIKNQKEG